jgi:type II secretory pathway pseudopilin PulG
MRQAKRIHNPKEQGAALIVVMSIILILTVLAAGTFNNSVRDFTIAMNRNYAQAAEQIAQSALHLALNRIEQDPLGFITALTQKQAESQNPTGCAQAKTLCLTPASFFPETNASSNLPHKGFNIKALLPDITLKTNSAPSVYPDFVVKIDPPIRSPYSKPAAGMSINNFAKMCTITLILTATGKVINPNVPNTNTHRHVLSQRIYRVHINVAAKGDAC